MKKERQDQGDDMPAGGRVSEASLVRPVIHGLEHSASCLDERTPLCVETKEVACILGSADLWIELAAQARKSGTKPGFDDETIKTT